MHIGCVHLKERFLSVSKVKIPKSCKFCLMTYNSACNGCMESNFVLGLNKMRIRSKRYDLTVWENENQKGYYFGQISNLKLKHERKYGRA